MKCIRIMQLVLAFACFAATSAAAASKIDDMQNHGDIEGLGREYAQLSAEKPRTTEVFCALARVTSSILVVSERQSGERPDGEKAAFEVIEYCKAALSGDLPASEAADVSFVAASMYDRLIRDASSWMRYNADKEKYLRMCLSLNPRHVGARLLGASSLIRMPESAGGNPAKGREVLAELYRENPENLPVMIEVAYDFRYRNDLDAASDMYRKILKAYPEYTPAEKTLDDITIIQKGLPIARIAINGAPKTPKDRLLTKTASFIGKKYSLETKDEIATRLREIASVGGCEIKAAPTAGETEVNLEITVNEKNTIVLGLLGFAGLSRDYDGAVSPLGIPALLYVDSNFFGTANQMTVVFAGPYISIDYFNPGIFDEKGPDVKFAWKSMFLESDFTAYEDGKVRHENGVKSPTHIASVGVGKELPIGLSAFINGAVKYENWKQSRSNDAAGFSAPSNRLTYSANIELSFSTIGSGMGSKLDLRDGFAVKLRPEALYQPKHDDWGSSGNIHSHDAMSEFRFEAQAEYAKKIFDDQGFDVSANWRTGRNMYETEKWSTGKGSFMSDSPCLDGFHSEEFRYASGLIGNAAYQINFIPSRLGLYAKYDVFLNQDDEKAYHGTAAGIAAKLPLDIQFSGQLGIGLNAKRERGPGYELDVQLMKIWLF